MNHPCADPVDPGGRVECRVNAFEMDWKIDTKRRHSQPSTGRAVAVTAA